MRSRLITGIAVALFVASMSVPGLPAQERAAGQLPSGAIFNTLLTFEGPNGELPLAGLVQGADGNFYGTTIGGGAYNYGTVFKITPGGTLTTLYSFCSEISCPDGDNPVAAMILGTDGNFYGTTYYGGANACVGLGCGTVFKITPAGTLTTLYSFCARSDCTDGTAPGTLVQGSDGDFYGTTTEGGSSACEDGCGTIFKITPSGMLTTLYTFNLRGGYYPDPSASLVQATDGNFYGTTGAGGSGTACQGGCGTVFQITPEGVLTTLHNFDYSDGAGPGALVQATDGNLYGTAGEGGEAKPICSFGLQGCGTVFKITLQGTFTLLDLFDSTNGSSPTGLVQATNGNFYGTGMNGGSCNCGVIFEVTPEGVLTRLHTFTMSSGGNEPSSGLLQATNGTFYGTTPDSSYHGGYGVIYSLALGLGPFINFVPPMGKIGAAVKILGNDLTGATSVTFNGTPATFTVGSATVIKTTVPAGATTGPVEVTLPSGTLTSNVNFQVLP